MSHIEAKTAHIEDATAHIEDSTAHIEVAIVYSVYVACLVSETAHIVPTIDQAEAEHPA